jgi:hypothetical protein
MFWTNIEHWKAAMSEFCKSDDKHYGGDDNESDDDESDDDS